MKYPAIAGIYVGCCETPVTGQAQLDGPDQAAIRHCQVRLCEAAAEAEPLGEMAGDALRDGTRYEGYVMPAFARH
jgi:hypothetical protein